MEKSILERSHSLLTNKKEKEKIDLELTDSTNFTKKQQNINGLSDPSLTELGNSSTQIIQSAEDKDTKIKKKSVFDNLAGDSDEDTLKSFDSYNKKKLLTQSMMDIALLSANASQLKHVLERFDGHYVSYICVVLVSISITLQILVGISVLLGIRYNVSNCNERKMAFKFGNYVIVGIFLITVVNILISAFGTPNQKPA